MFSVSLGTTRKLSPHPSSYVWLSQSGNSIESAKSSSSFFITKTFSFISTFQQSRPPAPTLRVDWRRLEFIAPLCADLRGQGCLKEHRDHSSRQRCVAAEDQVIVSILD